MSLPRDKDARRYYRVGLQRIDEARTIAGRTRLYAAAQYLGGYAVECLLKALLLNVLPRSEREALDPSAIEWLKREFGHDLHRLRMALARRGALMGGTVASEFLFVLSWNPEDRYDPGPGNPATCERFLSAVETVVEWAKGKM